MNETENRKSMDDVLASIRRIVRSEKQPDAETAETADDGPVPQEIKPTGDIPLALTPDMRLQEKPDHAAIAETIVPPSPAPSVPPAMPDDDHLRALIREVLAEEMGGDDMDALIRDVIRHELTRGDIGGNISSNVLRLVKSEIAKAIKG